MLYLNEYVAGRKVIVIKAEVTMPLLDKVDAKTLMEMKKMYAYRYLLISNQLWYVRNLEAHTN